MPPDPNSSRSGHGVLRGFEDRHRSRTFDGRFGRMFRNLPPAEFEEDDLKRLGEQMIPQVVESISEQPSPEDNPKIPAGYTYLGQFIDHDLTFDPVSSLQRANDPEALIDFRTPRFDLDSVYGRGPEDQPYLYQEDGIRLLLGRVLGDLSAAEPEGRDVPRGFDSGNPTSIPLPPDATSERALIGDPRNDENVIVTQLHAIFLRFHNRIADRLQQDSEPSFAEVQRLTRWHYQWVVLYDFLPKIVNAATYQKIVPQIAADSDPLANRSKLHFYRARHSAFLPIEFSAAAYRFAHSMVRPSYRLNRRRDSSGQLDPAQGGPFRIINAIPGVTGKLVPDLAASLIGFRAFNAGLAD